MKRLSLVCGVLIAAFTCAGCAALPFLPMLAELPMMLSGPAPMASARNQTGSAQGAKAIADANLQAAAASEAADPLVAAQNARAKAAEQADDGSIPFRLAHVDSTSDVRAHGVGDVLKVQVIESISGLTSAETDLSNKRDVNVGLTNMASAVESLAKHNPLLNLGDIINGSSGNDATGKGSMTANDTMQADISVVVVGVLPNGTMKINGARRVQLNGEDDTLFLAGLVRPEDIDSDNTIDSTRIADLDIGLTGRGLVRDKQGGGWGTRLLDWLWIF